MSGTAETREKHKKNIGVLFGVLSICYNFHFIFIVFYFFFYSLPRFALYINFSPDQSRLTIIALAIRANYDRIFSSRKRAEKKASNRKAANLGWDLHKVSDEEDILTAFRATGLILQNFPNPRFFNNSNETYIIVHDNN